MRIGYNPLVDFFHVQRQMVFYDDFTGNFLAQRTHGNIILDVDDLTVVMSQVFRPLWVIVSGNPVGFGGRAQFPAGHVVNQAMSTYEMRVGNYWRFDWQFDGVPNVNDVHIRFWNRNLNDFIAVVLDTAGGNISLFSMQGGGPIVIIAGVPHVYDTELHYVEVVYDGTSEWELYLDGVLIGIGSDVYQPQEYFIYIQNTANAVWNLHCFKSQNVSPI